MDLFRKRSRSYLEKRGIHFSKAEGVEEEACNSNRHVGQELDCCLGFEGWECDAEREETPRGNEGDQVQ